MFGVMECMNSRMPFSTLLYATQLRPLTSRVLARMRVMQQPQQNCGKLSAIHQRQGALCGQLRTKHGDDSENRQRHCWNVALQLPRAGPGAAAGFQVTASNAGGRN